MSMPLFPDFSQYDIWGPNTEEDSKNFVNLCISESKEENRYKYNLAIEEKSSGKVIGGVGFRRTSPNSSYADLGYAVNLSCQSKGYTTEAASAMINFAFKDLSLTLIYAQCDANNIASYKVMEKLGLKKCDLKKNFKEYKDCKRDYLHYEITK